MKNNSIGVFFQNSQKLKLKLIVSSLGELATVTYSLKLQSHHSMLADFIFYLFSVETNVLCIKMLYCARKGVKVI